MVTLKTDYSDGDIWYAGADLEANSGVNAHATQINTNTTKFDSLDPTIVYPGGALAGHIATKSMVACSSTTFCAHNGTNMYTGTYSGGAITWSGAIDDKLTSPIGLVACEADRTKLIAWSANATSYSSDSGATWTIAGTPPPNSNSLVDCHFITATLAIFAGGVSSGNAGWKSTDGGDTWAQVSGTMTTTTTTCGMYDATNGWFIDSSDNIFDFDGTTATDSTNTARYSDGKIKAITSSTYIRAAGYNHGGSDPGFLVYYDGINDEKRMLLIQSKGTPSNIVKASDNNFYVVYSNGNTTASPVPFTLCKSSDGIIWTIKNVGICQGQNSSTFYGDNLSEYTTGKLIWGWGSEQIYEINI